MSPGVLHARSEGATSGAGGKSRRRVALDSHATPKFHPGRSAAGVTPCVSRADSPADGSPRATGFRSPRYDTYVVGRVATRRCGHRHAVGNSGSGSGAERNDSGQGDVRAGSSSRGRECLRDGARTVGRHECRRQLHVDGAGCPCAWTDSGASRSFDRPAAGHEVDRAASGRDHAELRDGAGPQPPQRSRGDWRDRRDGTDEDAVRDLPRDRGPDAGGRCESALAAAGQGGRCPDRRVVGPPGCLTERDSPRADVDQRLRPLAGAAVCGGRHHHQWRPAGPESGRHRVGGSGQRCRRGVALWCTRRQRRDPDHDQDRQDVVAEQHPLRLPLGSGYR